MNGSVWTSHRTSSPFSIRRFPTIGFTARSDAWNSRFGSRSDPPGAPAPGPPGPGAATAAFSALARWWWCAWAEPRITFSFPRPSGPSRLRPAPGRWPAAGKTCRCSSPAPAAASSSSSAAGPSPWAAPAAAERRFPTSSAAASSAAAAGSGSCGGVVGSEKSSSASGLSRCRSV